MNTERFRRVRGMRMCIYGFTAGGVALVMALAAAAAPPAAHGPVTKIGGELVSMSAVSASGAWATGPSGDTKPLMMHWDGSTWTRVTVPDRGSPSLSSVSADSPSDAWAVGATNGSHIADVAMHWNGTKWTQVAVPSPGRSFSGLGSVSAAAPDDVWAVGVAGNLVTGQDAALVLHWNGTAWTRQASPNPSRAGAASIRLGHRKPPSRQEPWDHGDPALERLSLGAKLTPASSSRMFDWMPRRELMRQASAGVHTFSS